MKFFTKKSTIQKILVALILLLVINFTITPYYSYAGWVEDGMSAIGKELIQLVAWLGDVVMSALNNFMLGANGFGSAMLDQDDLNLDNKESWIYVDENEMNNSNKRVITFEQGEIDTSSFGKGIDYAIPNMLYSPENIFANNIAALDVNFLRNNTYNSIFVKGDINFEKTANEKAVSSAQILKENIANWYKSFRNIAIVGLLSVLVYLGIRILISSTAADKAKYKENLKDWVVALCLVFFIHFIMSAILMVTDKCTELFGQSVTDGYIVKVEGGKTFKTNLTGLIRFSAQSSSVGKTATYTIIYIALVIYTCIFTFLYFKRFLYMAFFTMIAPLVALTYPIDKVGDGKAQAFNMWFKEYTMNAIIQPVHLILYAVFVGSAYDLVAKNPIYALVAIAFLIPAEKFIKQMFGLNKAESTGGFGSFAGGAMTMTGLQKLANLGASSNKGKSEKGKNGEEESDGGIFIPPSSTGELSSFGSGSRDPNDDQEEEEDPEVRPNDPPTPPLDDNTETVDQQLAREKRDMSVQDYRELGLNPQQWEEQRRQEIEQERERRAEQQNQQERQEEPPLPPREQPPRREPPQREIPIKGYKGRVLKRGAKAVGKQLWKHKGGLARAAMRTVGTVAGGTIGLAASLTTGDPSKVISFMGAGALAGNAIGANAERTVANLGTSAERGIKGIKNVSNDVQRAWNEEKYGYDYAREAQRQKQNQKARKEFLKDEQQQRQYRELAAKMAEVGYQGDVKNLMRAAADYKEAGITDDKLIQNSLQAEYAREGSINGRRHEKFVEIASFAHENNFTREHITDEKKRKQLDTVIDTTVPGDQKAKREAALIYADIFDARKTYEKTGQFGKEKLHSNPAPAPNPGPNPRPNNPQ